MVLSEFALLSSLRCPRNFSTCRSIPGICFLCIGGKKNAEKCRVEMFLCCCININCANPNLQEQHAPPKWVQIVGGGFTKEDQFCVDIRRLQQRTGCTDATCDDIIRTFSNYLGAKIPSNFKAADQKIQLKAGAICLRLHGCVGCNKHVFFLKDLEEECPLCGHQRYNVKRKPNEVCMITHCMRIILLTYYMMCTILLF